MLEPYVLYQATPNAFASSGNPIAIFETTFGERFFISSDRGRIEQEFAYQFGSRDAEDLRAWLFSGQAHLRPAPRWTVGGGCDILSGDTSGSDFRLFDVRRIFHTGHKFYGIMDVAEALAGTAGLLDPYAVLELPGPRNGTVRLAGHYFRVMESAVAQSGPSGTSHDSNLGFELDAEVAIPLTAGSKLELGGAFFDPEDLGGRR